MPGRALRGDPSLLAICSWHACAAASLACWDEMLLTWHGPVPYTGWLRVVAPAAGRVPPRTSTTTAPWLRSTRRTQAPRHHTSSTWRVWLHRGDFAAEGLHSELDDSTDAEQVLLCSWPAQLRSQSMHSAW